MRKSNATTTMVSVLTCTTVFLFSACTLFQNNESRSIAATDQDASVYRGKIEHHPVDAQSHYSMGCVFQEKKKHRLAITEFEIAVQQDPSNVAAYNALGVSLDALGDYDRAQAVYKEALAIGQNFDYVLNNLGYSYLLQGRFELAVESFKMACELDSENQRYHNNLGLAYAKCGNYEAAFEAFNANGDEAGAHLNIARLHYRSGLYEKAAVHFAHASALRPSDIETEKGRKAAISLAQIHEGRKSQPIKTEAPPLQETTKLIARYDYTNDGFYTIPAGAIENIENVQIDQTGIAQNNYDVSNEVEPTIYAVSLARIDNPEEEQATTRRTLELMRLKILDEAQASERLGLEAVDTGKQPKPRVKIEVANGNGVRHMARQVGNYLAGKDFILMYLSNASHFNHAATSISYTKGYLEEAYRLSQELPGLQSLEEVPEIRNGNAKISVLVGRDLMDYLTLFEQV